MEVYSQHEPPRIRSTWQVRAAAGEPVAVVRVRNLQATVHAAQDAWGRAAKAQPLLVSAGISLRDAFAASSASDSVGADTVHYGSLSKAVLACLEQYQQPPRASSVATLRGVLETIWIRLTGLTINGAQSHLPTDGKALLDVNKLRSLVVTATLPKASLLGTGVSLTATSCFMADGGGGNQQGSHLFGVRLQLQGLRIPTLIGVNPNERLAKQIVAVDVDIDRFDYAPDVYTTLELVIVKAMEESSFETLEALGSHLADKITAEFRPQPEQSYSGPLGWQIRICMEKPTAVPFADAPCVEIRAGAQSR